MTTKRVIPRALAQRDIEAALDYYVDAAGVDVALKFVSSFESAYRIIAERPAIGSPRFAHELGLPGCGAVSSPAFLISFSISIGATTSTCGVFSMSSGTSRPG